MENAMRAEGGKHNEKMGTRLAASAPCGGAAFTVPALAE